MFFMAGVYSKINTKPMTSEIIEPEGGGIAK